MVLDLKVRIVLGAEPISVGTGGPADDERPELTFGTAIQLVDFELDELPFPGHRIARSGSLPSRDVEKHVLMVIFGFDEAEFAAFVHVPNPS